MTASHHTPEWRELCLTIARLDLISHGTTQSFDATSRDTSEGMGGKRPAGGISDDVRRPYDQGPPDEVTLRSADYYRKRARGCNTTEDVRRVLAEAQESLERWKKAPPNPNPEYGSFQWRKDIVAEVERGEKPRKAIAAFHGISMSSLKRYVAMYGEREAA